MRLLNLALARLFVRVACEIPAVFACSSRRAIHWVNSASVIAGGVCAFASGGTRRRNAMAAVNFFIGVIGFFVVFAGRIAFFITAPIITIVTYINSIISSTVESLKPFLLKIQL